MLMSFISTMWDVKEIKFFVDKTTIKSFISTMWDVKSVNNVTNEFILPVLSRLCGM